ncbi:MAG: protease pro-enzyme activation domain-containing protein, partial [Candidatus Sulfotelmatobacter sp.]
MIRKTSVYLLAIVAIMLAATVASQAAAQPLLTRHTRDVVINGEAKSVGRLPANQSMRLVLVLPLRNQAELEDFLRDLYDPYSPVYRHFLTVEQFTERFGPTQADYDTLTRFAEANGLTVVKTSRNRLNLDVTGSVANIEKSLNVHMGVYQHPTENRTFFAPDREPTPNVGIQLWHVSGLDNFSTPHRMLTKRNPSTPSAIDNATTGSCPQKSFCGSDMRAAYYGSGSLTGAGQSLGLFELLGTDLADLTTYYKNANQTNNVPITLDSVDGQSTSCTANAGCDDTEQTLDMTQAIGMAPGMSSLVMYIGKGGLSGQTVDDAGIFNAMATASPLNAQLSSSWAWRPADPNTDNPYFLEFAAQGQNLFDAAGDSGRWTASTEFVWPADSVYVVSVGGTDLTTNGAAGPWATETAWADGGGGISPDKYPIPSWQVTAAAGCADCSQTIRNGPDVSANANYTFYVCADQTTCTANLYGGTSFAAPMWAGYLALANQQAVQNGQPTLGFINPALYTIGLGSSYDADFHDITSGSNGWPATVGYDLATGWGSPNGSGLINSLVGATSASFTLSASPNAVSVAQGAKGTSTITSAISGGFDSAVALSASGQPTGVTVAFNPTSIAAPGSGTSTVTITVAATAVAGVYPITVTGTGGGVTQTTTVTLTVTSSTKANFQMGASPNTLTIAQGGTGTSTIQTKAGAG